MLNKKLIGKNFSRAAQNYQKIASTQQQAAQQLCQLVLPFITENSKVLDLGCGSGFIAQNLAAKNIQLFETDLSFEMLKQNRHSKTFQTQCDFTKLPFRDHSFDLLISSFSLQWLENFEQNFQQFANLIKPKGIIAFCLPTNDSLNEIKIASQQSGCNFYFHDLPQNLAIKSALGNAQFDKKVFHSKIIQVEFDSGLQALKSIKQTGANYSVNYHNVSKSQLIQFNNFCLKNFATTDKRFFLSWNVSFFIFEKSY